MKTKQLLFSLFLFAALHAAAQTDSTVNITLPALYHAHIIAFLPSKSGVEDIKYMNQVADQLNVRNGVIVDSMQDITVTVKCSQIVSYYKAIGSQQERLVAANNDAIKNLLLQQIYNKAALLSAIISIKDENASQTTEVINKEGFNFLIQIKQ